MAVTWTDIDTDLPTSILSLKVFIAEDVLVDSTSNTTDLYSASIGGNLTYQATVTGVGAVTANVVVEVSNDGIGWLSDSNSNIVLSGIDVATYGFCTTSSWQYARAVISGLSIGAAVTVCVASKSDTPLTNIWAVVDTTQN